MKNFSKLIKSKSYSLIVIGVLLCLGCQSQAQRVVVGRHRAAFISPHRAVVYRRPVVRVVPSSTVLINHHGVGYHYHHGTYYRYTAGGYIVVRPPYGFRLRILPLGYRSMYIGTSPYYYYGGIYYIEIDDGYEVVKAPENYVKKQLPSEYKKVVVDEKVYYLNNGSYYEKQITEDGDELFYNIGMTLGNTKK
ncbi:DUF6515 family protein [Ancylomarina sp. DW003]|nr:DUF6515 family protein [Ancylomarina sp. DW003]MDE5420587.1 DUF6515 family protein [Ancylomarina sp. DW003]